MSLVALDLLGDAHYLTAFRIDQIQALARQCLDVHGTAAEVGLIFFGLGAAVHSALLLKSRYIPRLLAGLYLAVALEVVICCVAIIVFPSLDAIIDPGFILPDFLVELIVGLWLLVKGAAIAPVMAPIASGPPRRQDA
jgi:hypothetical protein